MRNRSSRNISVLALGLFLFGTVQAATIYVDKTATGNGNGTSWSNAYTELATALPTANSGDQVWVAQGTYKPDINNTGNRNLTFTLKNGVEIYGGFRGGETTIGERNVNLYVTILNGDIGVVGDDSDNTYHVVTGVAGATSGRLDGFTVTKGRADGIGIRGMGGGMLNWNATLTIANCNFTGNFAKDFGGGMCNDSDSNVVVTNCTFTNNHVEDIVLGAGGGMSNKSSSPTVSNCTFSGNTASDSGGGMYNTAGKPTIRNCSFIGNTAVYGGGMHNTQCNDSFIVANCTFTGNSALTPVAPAVVPASYGGGGMSNISASPTVSNSSFTSNISNKFGGGVYNAEGSNSVFDTCGFRTNVADDSGGGIYSVSCGNYDPNLSPTIVIRDCSFTSNQAGGTANHTEHNVNVSSGGGAVFNYDSNPLITNCSFQENVAARHGGALYNFRSNSPSSDIVDLYIIALYDRNVFVGNSAERGGAVYNRGSYVVGPGGSLWARGLKLLFSNSLFYANSASNSGGAVYSSQSDLSAFVGCSFSWNSSPWGGAFCSNHNDYYFTAVGIQNCILWGDRATLGGSEYYDAKTLPGYYFTFSRSCVQGGGSGDSWADGSISDSPQFVDELTPEGTDGLWGTGDDGLRLLKESPCVDTGNNAYLTGTLSSQRKVGDFYVPYVVGFNVGTNDLTKNARIKNAIVDMGAYEGGISNPIAVNDSYSMLENGVLTVAAPGILGNDNDDGLPPPSAILVSNPTNGVLVFNANGSFTYTPYTGFFGTDSFAYRATNGLLSNLATVTITVIEVEDDVQIVSGPTVSSTTANPGDTLSFSVAAVSPLGYPVTYLWDFGDGTYSSEANPTHIYLVGGTYIVNVIISDGNSTKTVTFTVTISGGGGGGGDSGGSAVSQFGELKIFKMQARLNFRQPGRDQCRIQGMVDLPVGMAVGQRNIVLNVAGAQVSFTLNAKGTGKNDNGVFLLKRKRMSGFYGQGGLTNFQANLKNGNWSSIWSAMGMSSETTGGKNVVMNIYLGVDGHVYGVKQTGYYTARSGGGTLKVLR